MTAKPPAQSKSLRTRPPRPLGEAPAAVARPAPIGATVADGAVNFSLFSRTATGVELLLFDREDDTRPARVVRLEPATDRAYHYWHTLVPDVGPGQLYGYRV